MGLAHNKRPDAVRRQGVILNAPRSHTRKCAATWRGRSCSSPTCVGRQRMLAFASALRRDRRSSVKLESPLDQKAVALRRRGQTSPQTLHPARHTAKSAGGFALICRQTRAFPDLLFELPEANTREDDITDGNRSTPAEHPETSSTRRVCQL